MAGELAHEKLLLVEGKGDLHVVRETWLAHHPGPDVPFHIHACEGISELLEQIEGAIDAEFRIAIGFIFDANTDLGSRRDAFTDRARRTGLTIELERWGASGFIENREGGPRVGVWLMPDNENAGELEDFLWAMIPEGDALQSLATEYVREASRVDRRFRETKQTRAEMHSWLAVQEEPYPSGRAVKAGSLDAQAAVAIGLVRWLEKLFIDPL